MRKGFSSGIGGRVLSASLGLGYLFGCGVSPDVGGQQQGQQFSDNSPPVVEDVRISAGDYRGEVSCRIRDFSGAVVDSYDASDNVFFNYGSSNGVLRISGDGLPVIAGRNVNIFSGYRYSESSLDENTPIFSSSVSDAYRENFSGDVNVSWMGQFAYPNGYVDTTFTIDERFANNGDGSIFYSVVREGLSGSFAGQTESCEGTLTRR